MDILVATPGRLMDHMERTPGFTLQHLRYLVLDEVSMGVLYIYICKPPTASPKLSLIHKQCTHTYTKNKVDRLVNQSYQNWAPRVQEAAHGQTPGAVAFKEEGGEYALRPTTVRCVDIHTPTRTS